MIMGKLQSQRNKQLQRRFEWRVVMVSLVGLLACLTWALIEEMCK